MFAIVKDGVVQQLITPGTQFKIGEVTYHPTWCNNSSPAEKAAIGMVAVEQEPHPDTRFYWETQPTTQIVDGVVKVTYAKNPKLLTDRQESDKDGNPLYVKVLGEVDGKPAMVDSDERLVTKGIKTWYPLQITTTADNLIALTLWQDIRLAQAGTPVDEDVLAYRAAVVAERDRINSAIAAATTVDQVAQLQQSWPSTTDIGSKLFKLADKPYASWILDIATKQWVAPTAHPTDGKRYTWNESTTSWVESTI